MTTRQEQPPLTRRQAREQERSQENVPSPSPLSRRAVTTEPTAGGETPHLVTPFTGAINTVERTAPPATADDFDGVLASRPSVPNYTAATFASGSLTSAPPQPPAAADAPSFTTPPDRPEQNDFRPRSFAPDNSDVAEAAAAPSTDPDSPERTLTRRELRAMLAAQEAAEAGEAATEVVVSAPAAAVDAEPTLSDVGRRATWTPPVAESDGESRPVWETAPKQQTARDDIAPAAASAPAAAAVPAAAPPAVAAAPVVPALHAPVAAPAEQPKPVAPVTSPYDFARTEDVQPAKPIGHWSVAADHDEDRDVQLGLAPSFDQLLSRGDAGGGVSAGGVPTTTNALILPSIPQSGDGGPVALTTGEILVTGSFDLPRSLGATGALPDRIDSSEIDRMFELEDAAPSTGAQPIRASRAVSSHTSTRDVIQSAPKQSRWTVPFILSISAGVLAVGVIALIVAGLVSGIF